MPASMGEYCDVQQQSSVTTPKAKEREWRKVKYMLTGTGKERNAVGKRQLVL